jgi:adenylate cyclase/guanylate cyclase
VALAVAAMALGAYGRPVLAAPATAAMLAVYVGAACVIFSGARLVLPVVPPIVSAGSAIVVMLAYRLATEERERRKIRGLFQLYATRELVDRLEEDPARAGLGGERREITVMFTDVHGFTSFVENNPLPVVVRTLNDYLETITQVVLKHGGYVNKYLGDGMMALFGVFHGTPREAAEGACLAALELQERLKGFALRQVGLQRPLQETRVGIASGAAVVGNFGSGRRPEYTAVGDAVNVAARLQVLNKKTGTLVLVDDATRELVGGGFQAAPLGPHPVEGRAKPVEVFVLTSAAPATPGGRPGASGPP